MQKVKKERKIAQKCPKVQKRQDFILSVIIFAHGERVSVSCMGDFLYHTRRFSAEAFYDILPN